MNKLDPRVDANPKPTATATGLASAQGTSAQTTLPDRSVQSTEKQGHHVGRDAAVVGGVGGAAYEADKHHKAHDMYEGNTVGDLGSTSGAKTTAGPHSSNVANKADPTVDSDRSKDHHYGRDAAIAGGAGGAAYEADKHHKHDKDLTQAEKDTKKEHKHEAHEEKKERSGSKGLLGFLSKSPFLFFHLQQNANNKQSATRIRNTPLKKKPSSTARNANTTLPTKAVQLPQALLEQVEPPSTALISSTMLAKEIPTSLSQRHQETTALEPEQERRMLSQETIRLQDTTLVVMQPSELAL